MVSVVKASRLLTLASLRAGRSGLEVLAGLAPDLLLIEGGWLADYVRRRSALLPAEVTLMAQQWLLRPRSLFDVVSVHPGVGLELRDVLTGDVSQVRERSASQRLRPATW